MSPSHKLRMNWTVPVPVILAIFVQATGLAFAISAWKTSIDATMTLLDRRIAALESAAANNTTLIERVKGVEVNVEVLKKQNENIDAKLDKLIDRGRK